MRREGVIQFGDDFLIKSKTDEAHYADHPPGVLDPLESVHFGKPQFSTPEGSPKELKRHLVLNDFDQEEWNGPVVGPRFNFGELTEDQKRQWFKRLRKQCVLHELLNVGFEISVLHEGVLRKISHHDITTGFKGYSSQDPTRLSLAVCQKLNLPQKKVMLLDATQMAGLLSSQAEQKAWISFSDVMSTGDDAITVIHEYQKTEQLGVVVDAFNFKSQELLLNDKATREASLQTVYINGNRQAKKRPVSGNGVSAGLLEGLCDSENTALKTIEHLKLEYLTLTNIPGKSVIGENGNFTLEEKRLFPTLGRSTKKLSLLGVQMTRDDIGELLKEAHLESFELEASFPMNPDGTDAGFLTAASPAVPAFRDLKHISLKSFYRDVYLNIPSLESISLSNLDLVEQQKMGSLLSLSDVTQKKIKSLQLSMCSITAYDGKIKPKHNQFIINLLNQFSNLDQLELQDTSVEVTDGLRSLTHLVHLAVTHSSDLFSSRSTWDFSALYNFLSKTPALKTLQFSLDKLSNDNTLLAPNDLSLRNLEKIEITHGVMTCEQLKCLLRSAPNLKELVIHDPHKDLLQLDAEGGIHDRELNDLLQEVRLIVIGATRTYYKKNAEVMPSSHASSGTSSKRADVREKGKSSENATSRESDESTEDASARLMVRSHAMKESIDADTKNDPTETRELNKIFVSKSFLPFNDYFRVPTYRLDVYEKVDINKNACTVRDAFTVIKNTPTDITVVSSAIQCSSSEALKQEFKKLKEGDRKHFRAKTHLRINQEWQALPSLSPSEVLSHWMVQEGAEDIALAYSEATNLYYVRKKTNGEKNISVEYIVNESSLRVNPRDILSPDVKSIYDLCLSFSGSFTGAPLQVGPNPTGEDYVKALKSQKVGACRHRAILFMHEIDILNRERRIAGQELIMARYISSDCHAFVEVKEPGKNWVTCNLGGALVIPKLHQGDVAVSELERDLIKGSVMRALSGEQPGSNAELEMSATPMEEVSEAEKPTLSDYLASCCETRTKKCLIQVNGRETLEKLAFELQKQCHEKNQPYFYVNTPRELVCAADYIKHLEGVKGEVANGPGGPLYDFLQRTYGSGEKPVLIVNFDHFSASDFATYNTLVDADRMIDGVRLPASMSVVGLINPLKPGAYRDASFYSRFGDETTLFPFRAGEIPTPTVVTLSEGETVREDLVLFFEILFGDVEPTYVNANSLDDILNSDHLYKSTVEAIDASPFTESAKAALRAYQKQAEAFNAYQKSRWPGFAWTTIPEKPEAPHLALKKAVADQYRLMRPTFFDCHESVDWKNYLLGQWCLTQDGFLFEKGPLWLALEKMPKPETVNILNPPKTAAFERFWNEAKLKGYIDYNGFRLPLHPNFSVKTRDQVTLRSDSFASVCVINDPKNIPLNAFLLNQTVFQKFLFQNNFSGGVYRREKGILEEHQNKTIQVYVTDTLDQHTWSWFLEVCEKNHVKVDLSFASGVELPEFLSRHLSSVSTSMIRFNSASQVDLKNRYIESSDRDSTIAIIKKMISPTVPLVMDVSEMTANDLLDHISGKKVGRSFCFEQTPASLKVALSAGKTVVLHGTFSPALQHELSVFLLERDRHAHETGKLILVSEEKTSLASVCAPESHVVSMEEKRTLLIDAFSGESDYRVARCFDEARIERHPFATLQAIAHREMLIARRSREEGEVSDLTSALQDQSGSVRYSTESGALTRTSIINRDSAFYDRGLRQSKQHLIGVHKPPEARKAVALAYDENELLHAFEAVEAFNKKRKENIERILCSQPFVFLAGISGVGKTTFVTQYFSGSLNDTLFIGEGAVVEWARDCSSKRKILFIDEANITQKGWSQFEGLYETPPHIIIDGKYVELTGNHKVVFAGNPISYSDDRQLPSFIGRHGNSVWMKPFPSAYLYHEILLPILEISINPSTLAIDVLYPIKIAKPILDIAQFLSVCSRDEVLITPRELAMMALLTKNYCVANPKADPVRVSAYYAYQLSEMFVPKEHRLQFEERFKPTYLPERLVTLPPDIDFAITESNAPSANILNDFLMLRSRRIAKEAGFDSPHQKAAGLGGVLIEGEPGLGKSQLTLVMLKAQGIKEEGDAAADVFNPKKYYKVQSGWTLEQAKAFFKKAFHAGVVVIWDEVNSSCLSIERLLNNLLMGKDDQGNSAVNPGFLLIGTQNPAMEMGGRDMTSPAVLHRMHYRVLPPYSENEMLEILRQKGVSEAVADQLVFDHQTRKKADKTRCFRDLIVKAKAEVEREEVKAKNASQYAIEEKAYSPNGPNTLLCSDVPRLGRRAQRSLVLHQNVTVLQLCALATSVVDTAVLEGILKRVQKLKEKENVYRHLASNQHMTSDLLVNVAQDSQHSDTFRSLLAHQQCDDRVRAVILKKASSSEDLLNGIGLRAQSLSLRQQVVEAKINNVGYGVVIDLSGFDLTKIDLSKMNLNNAILAGATITASQLNYLVKFTANFTDVTVVPDGQKIKHKKSMRLDFTGADLRGVECDEWEFYRANTFARTKVDSKQFFQMSAGGLLTHDYKKGTEQHCKIKADLPIVITDLSKLDLTRFDLSEALITPKTNVTGAKLTSRQVNQLYEKGVRAFHSVIIVNDKENTLISYQVFEDAVFTKSHIPASQIERAYQSSYENGFHPVTEFKGLIVEGPKLTLDFTSQCVSPRSESVSLAAPSVDVGRRSSSRSSGSSFQLPTEGESPQVESPADDQDDLADLQKPLLASLAGSKTPRGESVASSRPDDRFVVEEMVRSLPRPLVLIDVDLSGVKKINFTDFTTLAGLTTEEVVINVEQAASLKGKSGTATFAVKNPPVSGLKSNLFGRSKKEAVPEITVSLERPDSGGSQPR